jgi:hypothetical protein
LKTSVPEVLSTVIAYELPCYEMKFSYPGSPGYFTRSLRGIKAAYIELICALSINCEIPVNI